MIQNYSRKILAAATPVIFGLMPTAAHAHPGHALAGGNAFVAGLLHPLSGADHLAALLLVGCWTAIQGRRQLLRLPAVVLAAMTAGFLSSPYLGLALAEVLIGLSVVVLAAAVALRLRPPAALAMPALALFGFGHGLAHGIESIGAQEAFMAGMLAASAILIAIGTAAGLALIGRLGAVPARD